MSRDTNRSTRRQLLLATGTASLGLIAGCASDEPSTTPTTAQPATSPTATDEPTPTPTDEATPTPTDTAEPTPTATPEPTPEQRWGEDLDSPVANQSITPDGSIETSDLAGWSLSEQGQYSTDPETIDDPLGGDVWLTWDDDNLYFNARIEDATHVNEQLPPNLYRGDAIQFGLAPGGSDWDSFVQYNFGLSEEVGTALYGQVKPGSENAGSRNFEAEVVHEDEETIYEIAIPWSELDQVGGFEPEAGAQIGVDVLIFDWDEETNLSHYVFGGGAVKSPKEPSKLIPATLVADE